MSMDRIHNIDLATLIANEGWATGLLAEIPENQSSNFTAEQYLVLSHMMANTFGMTHNTN